MLFRITLISDTHNQHRNKKFNTDLPGGDIIIHAGDISGRGSLDDIKEFLNWYEELYLYEEKIFIAGNHDHGFEDNPKEFTKLLKKHPGVGYLQDSAYYAGPDPYDLVKIYGSPWQPEFNNWAFNLPRNKAELAYVWSIIPEDTDILVTHGPPQGILDVSGPPHNISDIGCKLLGERILIVKPKIHVFGHVHGGYGYNYDPMTGTHYINASVLNERYAYANKPVVIEWDNKTNELTFI